MVIVDVDDANSGRGDHWKTQRVWGGHITWNARECKKYDKYLPACISAVQQMRKMALRQHPLQMYTNCCVDCRFVVVICYLVLKRKTIHAWRVNKLYRAGEIELVYKRMGKPSFVFSGYQYQIHQKSSNLINWVCVKNKWGKCKGKLKNSLQIWCDFWPCIFVNMWK